MGTQQEIEPKIDRTTRTGYKKLVAEVKKVAGMLQCPISFIVQTGKNQSYTVETDGSGKCKTTPKEIDRLLDPPTEKSILTGATKGIIQVDNKTQVSATNPKKKNPSHLKENRLRQTLNLGILTGIFRGKRYIDGKPVTKGK